MFLCLTWDHKLSVSSSWEQCLLQILVSASQPQCPGAATLGLPVLFLHEVWRPLEQVALLHHAHYSEFPLPLSW